MTRKTNIGRDDNRPDKSNGQRQAGSRPAGRRPAGKILNQQDCLTGLSQLPGMVILGLIKPGAANAVRATFRDILDCLERSSQAGSAAPLSNDDVLGILKKNPELLNSLGPMLTDEQYEMVRREIAKDDDQDQEEEEGQEDDEEVDEEDDQDDDHGADADG